MIEGKVIDSKFMYKRIVKIKPVEHHYEEPGERPYIKYGCPICELFGNRLTIDKSHKNCPLCGVNLFWDKEINVEELICGNQ